jgi:hypothetical protein
MNRQNWNYAAGYLNFRCLLDWNLRGLLLYGCWCCESPNYLAHHGHVLEIVLLRNEELVIQHFQNMELEVYQLFLRYAHRGSKVPVVEKPPAFGTEVAILLIEFDSKDQACGQQTKAVD